LSSEKILIVEDEKIIASDLKRRLEALGYEMCALCSTSEEAISIAESCRPQIVLMDIVLEGPKDGIATSIEIFQKFQIPTVFLTAYSDAETLQRAKQAQPLGYIVKPFKDRDLYTTLDMALYKARSDAKLRDHERWLSATLEGLGDGVIAVDKEKCIHYINPTALKLLGVHEESVIGQDLSNYFHLVDEENYMPIRVIENLGAQSSSPINKALLQVVDGMFYNIEGSISKIEVDYPPIGWVIVFRDVSQIKVLSQKIDHQSRYDGLTGLVNRREFTYILTERFFDKKKRGQNHALLYLDLDQFKLINDTCGHLAGDELLRQVSDIIQRQKDSRVVAMSRLGGDEFAVLYEDTDTTQALEKAWIIKHALNSHDFIWQNNVFKIRASLGLIPFSEQYDDVKTILAAADDACYIAKEEGGNRIKVYETHEDTFQKRRGEMRWINRLTRALENNHFVLFQQPIVPLQPQNQEMTKLEILIRLRDDDGKLILPFDFIPAAERYNLMPQIDRWVIRTALGNYHELTKKLKHESLLSINLSGESFADENLISFIKHELKKHQVAPGNICFEITETAAVGNLSQAVNFMNDLKNFGCAFSLDDFGSGLSSFAYLKSLPVDFLKIDGIFIKNLSEDPISMAMVEAIYKISKVMGIKTIAEYVATPQIREILTKVGIDYAQGYDIAKPSPMLD